MKVKIYVGTSIQGPCSKRGSYAAIIEYIKKDGQTVTRELSGVEDGTTHNRSALTAAVKALQMLKPCEVIIYTNCTFITNMAKEGKPEAWKREEWKNAKGANVPHKELWQQYLDEEKRHTKIEFRFSKYNDYVEKLQKIVSETLQEDRQTA